MKEEPIILFLTSCLHHSYIFTVNLVDWCTELYIDVTYIISSLLYLK
jgi:hypothetical protein